MKISELELAIGKMITPQLEFKLKSTTLNINKVENVTISLHEGDFKEGNYQFEGSANLNILLDNKDSSSETFKITGYALVENKDTISIHSIINIYKTNSIGL